MKRILAALVVLIPPAGSAAGDDQPAIFQDCANCPKMRLIEAARFERADDPNPRIRGEVEDDATHVVSIERDYAIGVFEVTFDEWDACVEMRACPMLSDDSGFGRGARPVINVSWHDAQIYVRWLSNHTGEAYRLPTEAEWEYAARGGRPLDLSRRLDLSRLCAYAVHADLSTDFDYRNDQCNNGFGPMSMPVGVLAENEFGLFDTAGNAWEWVEDCFDDADWASKPSPRNMRYNDDTPRNGAAFIGDVEQCDSRIMRGGSWRNGGAHAHVFSPRYRNFDYATLRSPNLGFRVARDVN